MTDVPLELSREEAVELLDKEPLRHFTMITLLRGMDNPVCRTANGCVFARSRRDGEDFALLTADSEERVDPLLPLLRAGDETVYVQGDRAAEHIGRHFTVSRSSDCLQLYLPESSRISADTSGIVDLEPGQAAYVHQHYSARADTDEEYLRDRIRQAPAIGVMVDGILAGFVMTHEELAMGVMEVLPEFRRRGLAAKLVSNLAMRMRELGLPCIVEITVNNHASLKLAAAAGFLPLQKAHWIHLGHARDQGI
jgi:GNAT superfamily N-acetyltransferase